MARGPRQPCSWSRSSVHPGVLKVILHIITRENLPLRFYSLPIFAAYHGRIEEATFAEAILGELVSITHGAYTWEGGLCTNMGYGCGKGGTYRPGETTRVSVPNCGPCPCGHLQRTMPLSGPSPPPSPPPSATSVGQVGKETFPN